jgi:hypothetical protein
MKTMRSVLRHGRVLAIVAMLAGCATDPSRVSVPAVGPLSGTPPGGPGSGQGTLRIFTQAAPFNDGQARPAIHAFCSIYTQAGKLVERFPNAATNEDAPPYEIKLGTGEYLVSVPTPGYGQVTVPVVIVANEITPLYLNQTGMANKDALPDVDLARLPDGRIAGRAAYPPPPPEPKHNTAKEKPKS